MISSGRSAEQYRRAQFETADRGQLLLLVFDGGLRFLGQAREALERDDLAQFGHFLGRSQAVIAELLHTLDHEAGGEIARNLERLYRFMLEHLVEANLAKSVRHVDDVRRILGIIASAYREILAKGLPKLERGRAAA